MRAGWVTSIGIPRKARKKGGSVVLTTSRITCFIINCVLTATFAIRNCSIVLNHCEGLSPQSSQHARPGDVLFPRHAMSRQARKIKLDEPHLLDHNGLLESRRPKVRSFQVL